MNRTTNNAPSAGATHRAVAEGLIDALRDSTRVFDSVAATQIVAVAQAEATLAQADAIDRLTAAIERMEFPALEVKKCLGGLGFTVRPKR